MPCNLTSVSFLLTLLDGIDEFYNILKDKVLTFISLFSIGKMIFSCIEHKHKRQNKLSVWNWHGYNLDFPTEESGFTRKIPLKGGINENC
jgi:hypothetical protein